MSKYTTELRFICLEKAGYRNQLTAPRYADVIKAARPKIFDFDYPIWDESKREEFETKILKHFFTHEIGQETYELWHMKLDDWLNVNMPFFNPLFVAVQDDYNAAITDDFTITADEGITHNDDNTTTRNKTSSSDTTTSSNSTYHSKSDSESTRTHTETPQGSLDDFLAGKYMSDADHDESGNTFDSNANSSGNGHSTNTEGGTDTEKRKGNSDRKLVHTEKGFRGRSRASILKDYFEANANIYNRLFDSMEVLFMQVW